MRIIILGGTGMLGHRLWQHFSPRYLGTYATVRQRRAVYARHGIFEDDRVIDCVDVENFPELSGVLKSVRPDFILNCIGVTKRHKDADAALQAITLNALLPNRLAAWGAEHGAKVVNFSTDCVFDGEKGNYGEESPTNATDLYGKTKALGEIQGPHALTLRSSFIGCELEGGTELLEWFLSQKGTVRGFKNALYSGFTTLELSRIVEDILLHHPDLHGLYNVSSEVISKFDLLTLIKEKMRLEVELVPEENFHCKRNLDSSRFRKELGYVPPSWESMVEELSESIGGKA